MIPLRDQEYLRTRFARELTGGVRIDYFTQRRLPIFIPGREECAYCEETQTLLKEIAALSDKITLNIHEFAESTKEAARLGVDKVPGHRRPGRAQPAAALLRLSRRERACPTSSRVSSTRRAARWS